MTELPALSQTFHCSFTVLLNLPVLYRTEYGAVLSVPTSLPSA